MTGRAHNKHTSGGDFREATLRALRQGLENTLLEPYYRFKMEVDIDFMGRVLSDIQKLNGSFDAPETYHNKAIITGRGPVAAFMDYSMEFTSLTRGKGKINFTFDGYDTCHDEEDVVKKIGYDKNADIDYTSTSIFCSKGQGFLVNGDEAKGYMHCLK
ncbi:elongation factor G [Clostridium magnum DSM 2767]|uniref:Elongation factor G n=1 Tax=Clostridium magnum DSM 2767 TaxID=1121326 RepID=A0A162RA76_9CLOT|nr:elongation factor G [Clostridium magnum DSM 2767]SHH74371.1 Elongation factor G C-terminus [Clostridium magnum DSM 2767]